MFFYFKKITVHNKSRVPKVGPVLILSNHQNGLLDPLLLAVKSGRYLYYLTRAGVFSKPWIAKIFSVLQMIPVYRVRDGWAKIANNNAIFKRCIKLLHNNEALVVFPEGSHNIKRMVRPLSKGFTRVVLDTLEIYPKTNLQLLPVGLNYENCMKFADRMSIYFGEPLSAKDFYTGDKNKDVVPLKLKIQEEMSKLTTNIPPKNYEETLKTLNALHTDFLNPVAVNACLENNFKGCPAQPKDRFISIKKLFRFLLICNFVGPYIVWKHYALPKIKEVEFIATFRFGVTIVLGPLWLFLITGLIIAIFGVWVALMYMVISLIIVLIAVKW